MQIQAWTFPDAKIDASADITANKVDVLKPQYYTLNDDGSLRQLTIGFNAYTPANIALVKQNSKQQYVMVSGSTTGMGMLTASRALMNTFTSAMLTFLQSSGFTGVELDFEGFGDWSPSQYSAYKTFVALFGNTLHAKGYKLAIDGPAISDNIYQGYYPWKWEDFNASLSVVDYLVVMAYDYQADQGAGNPVAPLAWISNICQWMLAKITDHSRIVVGINSYGYAAKTGSYDGIVENTYQQSKLLQGISTAVRDPSSGEMMWALNGISFDYSDAVTLQGKLNAVQATGITAMSVWHLGGGNPWFPLQSVQPAPSPQPAANPTLTLTQDQIKAIANVLSPDQVTAIKAIIAGQ